MSLKSVLDELAKAEQQAGRVGEVKLVAVTKGHSLEEIQREILQDPAGQALPLAESRGQELRDKVQQAAESGQRVAAWHFIGPIQRNKIKYLERVSLVHTLEALWQAQAIAEYAHKWGHAPDVLIQVHNGEAQKHGVLPDELPALHRGVREAGLTVRGLMVMAPYGQPQQARQVFARAAQYARELGLSELSMGMSDDFALAVQEGATLVRIGSKLFSK